MFSLLAFIFLFTISDKDRLDIREITAKESVWVDNNKESIPLSIFSFKSYLLFITVQV